MTVGIALGGEVPAAAPAQPGYSVDALEEAFASPPDRAAPWVFWYWLHGRVSRDGITADLEAMKRSGVGGAYLMPIHGPTTPPEWTPSATQLSPRFWAMVRHAAREARRLGLRLGMHVCDGFATAGGPWIDPARSMQQLVWTSTTVNGGRQVNTPLQRPEAVAGHYRDIAVVAFPRPGGQAVDTPQKRAVVTTSDGAPDAQRLSNPDNQHRYRSETPCWFRYEFGEPFTLRSVTTHPDGANYQCHRLSVHASDDGVSWRPVARLDAPRHGWQDEGRPVTHAVPETTARNFRFAWDPKGSEPGAEDLDSAKWRPVLKVRSIVPSSVPRVHHFRGKNASVWRIGRPTTDDLAPARLCVPSDAVVNLSEQLGGDGRLDWSAPPGEWVVMRFGHTSTGKRNETAGGGRGLECDKMDRAAVRLQFDRWFEEARRQVTAEIGPQGANDVLTTLHVDSWECGAQNWTADLPQQFEQAYGAPISPWLPALAGVPVESAAATEEFLHQFRSLCAKLVEERFFGTLRRLCDERGVAFSAECTAPTMPGDGMAHFAWVDTPMGEFWLDSPTHDKPTDMRDAISASHRYGKRVVQAEAFTQLRIAWDETPQRLKPLGDLHLAHGANRFVLHVWTHNPWNDRKPGQTLGGVGLYFQRDQPWVRHAEGWLGYLARTQAVLQAGKPVVDVAVELDDRRPRRALTPEKLVDRLPGLLGHDTLARETRRVENAGQPMKEAPKGVLASANIPRPEAWPDPLRGYHYDTVGGGDSQGDLAERYAYVHRSGAPPWNEPDLTSAGVPRDFEAFEEGGERAAGVAWAHRAGTGWHAYFVSNQLDQLRQLMLALRAAKQDGMNAVEVWDPQTGARRRLAPGDTGQTPIGVSLPPHGALFVVVRSAATAPRSVATRTVAPNVGPWSVSFEPAVGPAPAPRELPRLADMQRLDGLEAFAGLARCSTSVTLDSPLAHGEVAWLETGRTSALAAAQVNGIDCGVAWAPPWRVDVTKAIRPGENRIELTVASVWKNALLADQRRPEADRLTWTSAPVRLRDEHAAPLGVWGPVRILVETTAP